MKTRFSRFSVAVFPSFVSGKGHKSSPDKRHSEAYYSAFRQKFSKLWTSVAHSFLQQIAQNKSWVLSKANTLPRICKAEMQQASLLYYSEKPQSGGIWGCALRHCTSEPFSGRLTSGKGYPALAQCVRPVIRSDLQWSDAIWPRTRAAGRARVAGGADQMGDRKQSGSYTDMYACAPLSVSVTTQNGGHSHDVLPASRRFDRGSKQS